EFGLWVSIDGGKNWAQFKGNHFPAVAVRDLAVHPRDNDLILATHGRGIWIIDDITPLHALTPDLLNQDVAFVSARPVQQRIEVGGIRGPRLVPGMYTVRLTKAGKVSETKLTVGLDRRAKFTEADRKAQFDAAMRVHSLFDEESALMDRIVGLRKTLAQNGAA